MGHCGGKRGRKFEDDGTLNKKNSSTAKTPKPRGIGYVPKAITPSCIHILVAAMPLSEVAVLKDVVTGFLEENCTCIMPPSNHHQRKKDKTIHSQ